MAVEPAIMQVISKSTDYSKEKVNLELFETSIKGIIRKIKGQAGDTLNAVSTGDYISDSLLADIKTKQAEHLTDFNDYISEIDTYAATDPRTDLTPYETYTYNYSTIDPLIIQANDQILQGILDDIMNNEGFYWERRVSIVNILWYIRNIIINTNMFGFYEVNVDNLVAFTAILEEDLILDDIWNGVDGVLDGGDQTMLLQSRNITRTTAGTTVGAIAADEVLWSIDKISFALGTGDTLAAGLNNNGDKEILLSANDTTTPIFQVINNVGNMGIGAEPYITTAGSNPVTATLYYTVRKIIVFT